MLTYSELLKNRKLGLSYKESGEKKLRTDPSKDEVLTVYKVLHQNLEGDLSAVESVNFFEPCQSMCTPLCYMFDSELDQVANCALPSEADLLQGNTQNAVMDKL